MSMNAHQLRGSIESVLKDAEAFIELPIATPEAVELLMLIAAQESHLGTYLHQINGPAKGIFQIEPRTAEDIIRWAKGRPMFLKALEAAQSNKGLESDLAYNLVFQILMARFLLWRQPEPLPGREDVQGLAQYWKKYHNTYLGAGTVSEAVRSYKRLVKQEA